MQLVIKSPDHEQYVYFLDWVRLIKREIYVFNFTRLLLLWNLWVPASWLHLIYIDIARTFACHIISKLK